MIICHISSMHESDDGRIFQRACIGLAKKGHDVKFIVTGGPGERGADSVEVIRLSRRSGIKRRVMSSFEAYRKASKVKADIFHFHDPDLIPWMLLLSLSGRKIIYDIHENYETKFKGFLKKIYRTFENFVVNRFDGAVVVTNSMKNVLCKVKSPVIVIDNLVSVERLRNEDIELDKNRVFTIYTSGNNTPARNCMKLIEALPYIVSEVSDIKVQFVGRYHPSDYKERLSLRAQKLNVLEYVEFEGMLPWVENFKRTAKAHIGCVFYEDNSNNKVTLPNRLYEYMYCGTAVLGENFPEVRRVIEDASCGLLVNSSNPRDIADKALALLRNPDEMIKMGASGRKSVFDKYNYERALISLEEFYYKLLNRN